jgi:RecB family exonuclease
VASLAPELAFRDVLGVITSSYFSPGVLGDFDARSVAAAEMIIREGNVLAGREAYAKAAERLARRPTEPAEDDDEPAVALGPFTFTPQAILKAAEMLNRLFDLSEGPGRGTCAAKIAAIMEGLQLYRAASSHDDPALAARDLRALAALQSALAELDEPDVSQARLRDALAAVMCPAAHTEALVDVMDVLDARSLRYDHVFLLGLSEGQFPHRFTESPLVSEADRLAWARRGMVLDCRGDLTAREMLLFYLAVSRADVSLTLSYVEADASGRPSAAGSFLESLLAPAGGLGSSQVREITEKLQAGAFLPPAGCLSSRRDALNAALGGLFEGDDGNSQCALAWVARNSPAALERACEGLWAQSRRNTRGPCDNFDGRITDRACLEILSRRFGPDAVFSATQLNAYGQCPWQFFASYVLHLAAISEPQRRLEPVARGIFCHDVLFRLMSGLSKDSGGSVRLYEIDDSHLMERLAGAVADASAVVEAGKPPYPVLWRLQREQMHADLRDYLRAAAGRSELSPETIHVELGFGLAGDAKAGGPRSESLDPASRDEPIALDTGAGVVRIRGKIDRVDRISFQGRRGLFVIDYKTGSPPRQADIQAGRNLQLPLYSTAAEKILAGESLGGAFHRIGAPEGRYETCLAAVRRRGGSYGEDAEYARKLQAALLKVGQFAAEIRGGRFDLLPTGDCPAYCPFRQICQFSEFRVELKTARGQEPRK